MYGLDTVDLKEQGLLDRLLKRPVAENAFRELQNKLAKESVFALTPEWISSHFQKYGLTVDKAKPQLSVLFTRILQHMIVDGVLTDKEVEEIRHLETLFGFTSAESEVIREAVILPLFERAVRSQINERGFKEGGRAYIDQLATQLRISANVKSRVLERTVGPIFQRALDDAISDRHLSPAEEQELQRLATNLGLTAKYDEHTQRQLEYFRQLWCISQGQMQEIAVPIYLQKGERCFAFTGVVRFETRTITTGVYRSGVGTSFRVMKGVYLRSSYGTSHRTTADVLKAIDSGILYVTNKRLIFSGELKTVNLPWNKIIDVTVYQDGMKVEKDTGKPQIFQSADDFEFVGAIVQSALSFSREPEPKSVRSRKRNIATSAHSARPDSQNKSPYEVLGLHYGASAQEVAAAYRTLASKYHPDKVSHLAPEFQEMAEIRMKEINIAYQQLRNVD